jgi:hypothetical protein
MVAESHRASPHSKAARRLRAKKERPALTYIPPIRRFAWPGLVPSSRDVSAVRVFFAGIMRRLEASAELRKPSARFNG